jgi:hypothetical protein
MAQKWQYRVQGYRDLVPLAGAGTPEGKLEETLNDWGARGWDFVGPITMEDLDNRAVFLFRFPVAD